MQDSLKQYVAANGLKGGDKLPPEARLADALGVSRSSVREAVKALESVGILATRRGVGVFVSDFALEPLLEHLTYGLGARDMADILEVRRTLEMGLIARAVALIGAEDLSGLTEITAAMHRRAEAGHAFPEEDRAFHATLFRCLGNRAVLRLIDVFWLAFHKGAGTLTRPNPNPLATWRDHAAILDAVRARDPEAARSRLEHHYQGIAERLCPREDKATNEGDTIP